MDPALLEMLTETVQHAAYTGQDSYGTPTFAAPVARPARVEYGTQRFTTAQGQERVSRALVYFAWDFPLDLRDQVTLDDGSRPALQRIDRFKDEVGNPSHYEVYI